MTRHSDQQSEQTVAAMRNWQSVRTLLEALILAALLWATQALTETQKQIAVLQVDIANLRMQMTPLATLDQRVTRLEALNERKGVQ